MQWAKMCACYMACCHVSLSVGDHSCSYNFPLAKLKQPAGAARQIALILIFMRCSEICMRSLPASGIYA